MLSLFFTLHLLNFTFLSSLFFYLFSTILEIKFTISVDVLVLWLRYNHWTFQFKYNDILPRKSKEEKKRISYKEDREEYLLRPLSIQPLQTNT